MVSVGNSGKLALFSQLAERLRSQVKCREESLTCLFANMMIVYKLFLLLLIIWLLLLLLIVLVVVVVVAVAGWHWHRSGRAAGRIRLGYLLGALAARFSADPLTGDLDSGERASECPAKWLLFRCWKWWKQRNKMSVVVVSRSLLVSLPESIDRSIDDKQTIDEVRS